MPPNDLDFPFASLLEVAPAFRRRSDQNAAAIRRISGAPHEVRTFHIADQSGH